MSWFDRYYLSGLRDEDLLSSEGITANTAYPNPYLVLAPKMAQSLTGGETLQHLIDQGTATPTSAANFMIEGSFNINSTSVKAWSSILKRNALSEWDYYGRDQYDTAADVDSIELLNSFARFGMTGRRHYDQQQPVTNPLRYDTKAYQRGFRSLTDEQIDSLAAEIVLGIRSHGRPFRSMEEFLSPPTGGGDSLLEAAIERAGINDVSWSDTDEDWSSNGDDAVFPDERSAAYLTQADIMTSLAPFVNVRSDTFKVRAYGEKVAVNGDLIAAVCEALVVRSPETLEVSDDVRKPIQPFGRRYEVVSFRWLNLDEL